MDAAALRDLIAKDRASAGRALDAALRSGHGMADAREMLALHLLAAAYWQADGAQAAFHRTHAYVYALEAGDWAMVDRLFDALAAEGRI